MEKPTKPGYYWFRYARYEWQVVKIYTRDNCEDRRLWVEFFSIDNPSEDEGSESNELLEELKGEWGSEIAHPS